MLALRPITLREANAFVAEHHRHHGTTRGHKVSVGVERESQLVGVAIVGRPVARALDDGRTAEITRLCVLPDTSNAASMLLGACRRAARALGYTRVITYTQDGETGASLRAAGFIVDREIPAKPGWNRPGRPRASDTGGVARTRWRAA